MRVSIRMKPFAVKPSAVVLIVCSVIANSLITLSLDADKRMAPLTSVLWLFVALAAVGVITMLVGQRRAGAMLALVGSAVFIPIGLVGAIGARQVLDQIEEEGIAQRRL